MQLSQERREEPRVEVLAATAVVLARHNGGVPFEIENISLGGVRLIGELTLGLGEVVELMFELDGHPIDVKGRVVRVERRDAMTDSVAIAFVDVPAEVRERIQRFVICHLPL